MNPFLEFAAQQTRRQFFASAGIRAGAIALAGMSLPRTAGAAAANNYGSKVHPALPEMPHHKPTAKRLIYLHMNGAPSQLDMWDYKPQLKAEYDKELPDSVRMGQRITTMTSGQARFPVAPSLFKFAQHGKCGRWASELIPHTAACVDDLALIKTVHTSAINHDPACTFIMTGSELPGKASLGSWISYGLGSENENLPAFVVLTPVWSSKAAAQALFTRMWSSGFLSTKHAGVALRAKGDPVLYVKNPPGVDSGARRDMLDSLGKLNEANYQRFSDPETLTRIAQYEMAFRMQTSVPDLIDISKESKATLDLYGEDVKTPGTFAASCLLARRLAERNVRV
ncbi:MAG: DUF1501 domain-containing protein, partial [Terriglobales bacterium]